MNKCTKTILLQCREDDRLTELLINLHHGYKMRLVNADFIPHYLVAP